MTTTTRRTILAGAAALPLLPAAALAAPITLPLLPVSELATETRADAELIRLGAELDHAWARELALICDDGDCRDGYEAANDAATGVVRQIEQLQAHTLEGLRVKARAVMWCWQWEKFETFSLGEHQTTDIRLSEAIIRDLVGVSKA